MSKIKFNTRYKKLLADTITPVSTYLKLRDQFPNSLLLESSDYHSRENNYSYICCEPQFTFKVDGTRAYEFLLNKQIKEHHLSQEPTVVELLKNFVSQFAETDSNFPFSDNGIFGYTTYDSIRYFEDIKLESKEIAYKKIPEMIYSQFRFVLVFDHFKNELYIFDHQTEANTQSGMTIKDVQQLIENRNYASFSFKTESEERSNLTNEEYMGLVSKGKMHCRIGDVFQIVLSREFKQKFRGDEFNVYRALRAINPSPYLFYFDYGDYKIFGSSPEAQLTVRDGIAAIHPIAGTYRRQDSEKEDRIYAERLKLDVKENSEHVMLVDLARNDLSRNSSEVEVEVYGEIQYYSHVIHMVSKVTGKINPDSNTIQLAADTFPAGTLSGAPKIKAMQLIDSYENHSRGFYGGAVGYIGLNGDYNHAIIIRSFLSKENHLIYQAGAGIVVESQEENELNEVNNKIAAVRAAIVKAEEI
ncbi:MAG: anthranilate synthase component I [Bacteroidetes bacterium HGW-Bacteroidetes-17]|jgi:anthranilate synthase component 1|nr:MAG: anthranilate synthase component I [Bacteroidetes bacterium HGW-Bacteroidetes-17]